MEDSIEIVRRDKPNQLDDLPNGSVCYIQKEGSKSLNVYLRIANEWTYMGVFSSIQSFRDHMREKNVD